MSGIPTTESYPMPTADSLPANVAGWTADADRAVLLVHDMQRYFLRPLPPEPRDALVDNCARLRDAAAEAGIPVCYSAQPGDMTVRQRGLLRDFWGPGMRTSPSDREIVDELAPTGSDRVFTKWRYSAFVHTDLLETMRRLGRDQIVLCGVYAHVGLLATAIEAFSHDVETFLVADAVADFTEQRHLRTLEYASVRCASVQVTAEVLAWLDASRTITAAVGS